jgi:hypothetical protein
MNILNNSVECDLWKMNDLANYMNIDSLYIFSIIISDTFECKISEIDKYSKVKYIEIGIRYFMENYLNNSNDVDF